MDPNMKQSKLIKVLIVGDYQTGKSNILSRFSKNAFIDTHEPTIGVEFGSKLLRTTNMKEVYALQIWDTAGDPRFKAITRSYYRGAHVLLIAYDITNRASFESISTELQNRSLGSDSMMTLLVGTKKDLEHLRVVSEEEAEIFAAKNKLHFIEISTKHSDDDTNLLFQWVIDLLEMKPQQRAEIIRIGSEENVWGKTVLDFWLTSMPFMNEYNGLKLYAPIVKLIAPGLLDEKTQKMIVAASHVLTPNVISKITVFSHFLFYDTKAVTFEELIHVYLISIVIKSPKLSDKVFRELVKLEKNRNNGDKILDSPKKFNSEFAEFSDIIKSAIELHSRFTLHFEDPDRAKKRPEQAPLEEQWRNIVRELYDTREQSGDLTVQLGDQSYKVHKLIVAFTCDFFRGCLLSQFKEADTATLRIEADVTNTAWEALLLYLYTRDTAHISDPDDCLSILSVSPYFMMTNETKSSIDHAMLLRHCEQIAYDSITDDTVFELLLSAHNSEDRQAKDITVKYILYNYVRLFEKYESEMSKLPKALMFGLMTRMWCSTTNKTT